MSPANAAGVTSSAAKAIMRNFFITDPPVVRLNAARAV